MPKKRRLLVDLHTNPLTVTGSHRVVVPRGEVAAEDLNKSDDVLTGRGSQQLLKVAKRMQWNNVMELEFARDAIIEDHASSILTNQ